MNIHVDNLSLVDSEEHFRRSNIASSNELLALLEQHHGSGFIVVKTPAHEPGDETVPQCFHVAPSLTHFSAPKELFWFSIESDDYAPVEPPKIQDIKLAAARYFKISPREIDSARRMHRVVYPRQIVMFLARALTLQSLPDIGRRLGGRDHTTVIHGINKIQVLLKTEWLVAYDVAHIEAML